MKENSNNSQKKYQNLKKKKIQKNFMQLFIFILFFVYLFLPLDIIPDILPLIGFLDDAVAFFIAIYTAFSPLIDKIIDAFKK